MTELRRSFDNGRTWSSPVAPFSNVFAGIRGSLQVVYVTVLGSARLLACALWIDREAYPGQPLFHPETEGALPMRILLTDSDDFGLSWSEWREVPVPVDIGPPSLTSPVVRLPGGRLILSIETNKNYLDRSKWVQRVVHCESSDDGRTWTPPKTVCEEPTGAIFHWDQRIAAGPDGLLAAFSWVYDKAANRYLPIRRQVSRDQGRTWVEDELDFSDQPAHPAVLPDGRTALAWVDRYGSRSIRARAAASLDGRFEPESEVTVYRHLQAAATTHDTAGMLADMGLWSFGLPYAEVSPSGEVILVYYAGSSQCMDIRWSRLTL